MTKKLKIALAAVAVAAVAAIPLVGGAVGDDDASDQPIVGDALETATQAALKHLGEGTVTGTEIGDEESYYEVEVTLDNGNEVDVQLDEDFNVVGSEDEGSEDDASGDNASEGVGTTGG